MTPNTLESQYDQIPYPTLCFAQTHPDRLASIGALLGMQPSSVERCRVLELGCASGGNLIPMAYGLPGSEFIGIDLSGAQIAEGAAFIEKLGLTNITLRHLNILDFDDSFGTFDYIIAHGVYSWVPDEVRRKVLQICRAHLAPQGVAYVSYNAFPGWHMLDIVRDLMRFRTRELPDPEEKLIEARSVIDWLAQATSSEQELSYALFLDAYRTLMEKQATYLAGKTRSAMLHDELEDINQPFYFHQFIDAAGQNGLQYLAEAEFAMVMPNNLPTAVSTKIAELSSSMLDVEQYMDFVRNRTFRQTLLVHEEIDLQRGLRAEPIYRAFFSTRAHPETDTADTAGSGKQKFIADNDAVFTTDHPVTKAAMHLLTEAVPQALSFDELWQAARTRVGMASDRDRLMLAGNLLQMYCFNSHLVSLHSHRLPLANTISARPVASALARLQLTIGPKVTNMRHENVVLEDLTRVIVPLLDGEHDRAALLAQLLELWKARRIGLQRDGATVSDSEEAQMMLSSELEANLTWLCRAGYLIG